MTYWKEKVALVVGGSQGLGLAIARALTANRARVIIAARGQEQLAAAAASLATSDHACGWLMVDVHKQDQVDALSAEVICLHGRLDAVFFCVGKSDRGHATAVTAEQFAKLIDLNFLSAVRVTQAALPFLLQSRGHLVFIGSLASKTASRYLGAYPVSKFPLAAYAQQLRLELADEGVRVLHVCPGPIRRDDAGLRYDDKAADLPVVARQPGGGVKLKGLDPDWLARRILTACERGECELVVPFRARLLFALAQLSPALGDWVIGQMTRRS
jgi:NAD(P)-dependent dehydrogenase (short-subunit alcohol dehydrogenase family)